MTSRKIYDLEERTLKFSKALIRLCRSLTRNAVSVNIISQLMRSGTSVGANYREANESLSRKDFLHRVKISRKECKETEYWLDLLQETGNGKEEEIRSCSQEAKELRNILSAIIINSS